ncbi:MAG: sulfatase-like hydrolase/transferase, partial [Planctomycetes bacterium]|nr:sulfatase-like hydrolase/transferase [Planctomycetota bacterium]
AEMSKGRSAWQYFGCVGILWAVGMLPGKKPALLGTGAWWEHQAILLQRPATLMLLFSGLALTLGTAQLFMFRSRMVTALAAAWHFLPAAVLTTFFLLEKRLPVYTDMGIMADGLANLEVMGRAVILHYGWAVAGGLVLALPPLAALVFLGRRLAALPFRPVPAWLALALYATAFGYLALYRHPVDIDDTPIYSRVQLYAVLRNRMEMHLYGGLRSGVELPPPPAAVGPRHLVYIMDESITGRRLSLNGYGQPTTPYLESIRSSLVNYGSAMAATNASKTSNIIAISGLRQDQLPDREMHALRQASIFQYAAAAGRTRHYLDCQNGGAFLDYMRKQDFFAFGIDHTVIDYRATPPYQTDREALARLRVIMDAAPGPTFTYFLKNGCHFQYDDKFPPGAYTGIFQNGDDAPEAYLRALRWAVDDFFREAMELLGGHDVLLVYTSDHGQSFGQGHPLTHTTLEHPPRDQADVPLLLIPLGDAARSFLSDLGLAEPGERVGRMSHFEIFPTLLKIMGYPPDAVRERFGPGLDGEPPAERFFLSGDLFPPEGSTNYRLNPFD